MKKTNTIGILAIFRREIKLMNAIPLLWVSFVVISLVPAFYALTYLGSIWDPYEKLQTLPAGLVNMDSGMEFNGKEYNLGGLLVEELNKRQAFGFLPFEQREKAENAITSGEIYFALVIPEDFSRRALPGRDSGELELITSSGTSYTASLIAQKFTEMAVESLNHRLELERWQVVLTSGTTALSAAKQLETGAQSAMQGSVELSRGIIRARSGVTELHKGQTRLADGLAAIDTERLATAGRTLHGGTEKLATGLMEHKMIDRLAGIDQEMLKHLADGAGQYQVKVEELAVGLEKATAGAKKLQQGGEQLTGGFNQLQKGSESLTTGLQNLHTGLEQFAASFPEVSQNAENMAVSVTAKHTRMNPVETNGQGFSPFLMGFSLWIGAMSASFVYLMTTFSVNLEKAGATARVIGKELAPALMCVTGALILGVAIQLMGTVIHDILGYYLVLVLAALTYNSIVLLLIRLLGDSGKLVALLLLVVQLASASGAYPIELSAPFYQSLSPYLPMTSVVDGLRAAMFGSFGANWGWFALKLLPWFMGSLLLSHLAVRRSSFVADSEYGPALKLAFGKSKQN